MKKELGVSIQTSGWYNPLYGGDKNPVEAFTKLKEFGFDAIDYNIDIKYGFADIKAGKHSAFYSQDIETILEYFRPVKEALDKTGVFVGQTHAPFPSYVEGNDDINEHIIEVIGKCMAVCQYLECPAIVVHPYTNTKDRDMQREVNLALYRKLIPYAKKYGVKVCLENMVGHGLGVRTTRGACADMHETVFYIDTLNAEAGEDVFGFCLDLGHANITGNSIYHDILDLGHRLTVLHIHDNDAQNDLHLAPYTCKSAGHNNITHWNGLMRGLRQIGYRGTINFETFASFINTPIEAAPAMLSYIGIIGKYFRDKISGEEEI